MDFRSDKNGRTISICMPVMNKTMTFFCTKIRIDIFILHVIWMVFERETALRQMIYWSMMRMNYILELNVCANVVTIMNSISTNSHLTNRCFDRNICCCNCSVCCCVAISVARVTTNCITKIDREEYLVDHHLNGYA